MTMTEKVKEFVEKYMQVETPDGRIKLKLSPYQLEILDRLEKDRVAGVRSYRATLRSRNNVVRK